MSATVSISKVIASGQARFTQPVDRAVGTVSTPKVIASGLAAFTKPVYNALGTVSTSNLTLVKPTSIAEETKKLCDDYSLKTVEPHLNSYNISNTIESNLKFYYDMHMLKLGGWTDVNLLDNDIYNKDNSRLNLVNDPNYTLGQVWETPRKKIVWEKNINFLDNLGNVINPLYPSEPTINGHKAIEWEANYYIDYENGRVIFDKSFAKNSIVKMSYSYKYVQIYKCHDLSWWQEFQMNLYKFDTNNFTQIDKSNWSLFSQNKIQLPAIIIETYPQGTCKNVSLGTNTKNVRREIFFHIYAENKLDRDNIMDIISLETDRQIWLFDINKMNRNKISIFDHKNEIINDLNYNDLIESSTYRWKQSFLENGIGVNINQITPTLHQAVVKKIINIML